MAQKVFVAHDADVLTRTLLHNPEHPLRPDDPALAAVDDAPPVRDALAALGYDVIDLPLGRALAEPIAQLRANPKALVFNLCDTLGGESAFASAVPAVLEAMGMAFAGTSSPGISLSKHKHDVKAVLE